VWGKDLEKQLERKLENNEGKHLSSPIEKQQHDSALEKEVFHQFQ
jgi:hypothetical protein